MTCVVCRITQPIEKGAEVMAKILNGAIAPEIWLIFKAFMLLWALHLIIVKGILEGNVELSPTIKQICLFAVIGLLLRRQTLLWELIYTPLKEMSHSLIQLILNAGLKEGGSYTSPQEGLTAAIDGIMQQMIELGKAADFTWRRPFDACATVGIMALYIFVGAISVAWVLEYTFKVFWISSFSSILLLCLAFKATRQNAYNALFSLFGSLCTICFSIMSMSLTLMIYRDIFRVSTGGWVAWGADWLALVMLGFISIYMQKEARGLASTITGVSDGSGMAMAMAGGATTAIGMAAGLGGGKFLAGVGMAAKGGLGAVKAGASVAKKAWDAYKSKQ